MDLMSRIVRRGGMPLPETKGRQSGDWLKNCTTIAIFWPNTFCEGLNGGFSQYFLEN